LLIFFFNSCELLLCSLPSFVFYIHRDAAISASYAVIKFDAKNKSSRAEERYESANLDN